MACRFYRGVIAISNWAFQPHEKLHGMYLDRLHIAEHEANDMMCHVEVIT